MAQTVMSLSAVREAPGLSPGLGRSPGEGNGNPHERPRSQDVFAHSPWGWDLFMESDESPLG